ncbi:hypothetical protein D3C85_977690 [compost metagenome]
MHHAGRARRQSERNLLQMGALDDGQNIFVSQRNVRRQAAIADTRPVHQIGLAVDPGLHDDMVERADHWQILIERQIFGGHQNGNRVDAQFFQQRHQKHGLALAVALTPCPDFAGRGWQPAALAERQGHIAHLVLNQSQRRQSPGLRGGVL